MDASKKTTFLKILQKKAGDKSILTRAKSVERDTNPIAPLTTVPARVTGGPVGFGVVCSSCLQPATLGDCKLHRGTECGPWINEKQTEIRSSRLSDACWRCTHGSSALCKKSNKMTSVDSPLTESSTPLSTTSNDNDVFFPDECCSERASSTFWIGCKFIYSLKTETVKVSVIQNGRLPYSYSSGQKVHANIILARGDKNIRKTVSLGTVERPKTDIKVKFHEHSCFRVQHMSLAVDLFVETGLFRKRALVESWTVPLTECHFLYPRTKWHYVE